jgi:hypothetical protein
LSGDQKLIDKAVDSATKKPQDFQKEETYCYKNDLTWDFLYSELLSKKLISSLPTRAIRTIESKVIVEELICIKKSISVAVLTQS